MKFTTTGATSALSNGSKVIITIEFTMQDVVKISKETFQNLSRIANKRRCQSVLESNNTCELEMLKCLIYAIEERNKYNANL